MAISRMQQPRQMYGLGSFVKKATRKLTKPVVKIAKKLVPKEIAGIMRVAAPFMGPVAGPLAYLAGTAKQTGRLSPMDLALAAIPKVSTLNLPDKNFLPTSIRGENIGDLVRNVNLPFDIGTIGDVALGDDGRAGILGAEGRMINILKSPGDFLKTKPGQVLLGGGKRKIQLKDKSFKTIKDPEKLNLIKAVSLGLTGGEYVRANRALKKLASEAGSEDLIDDLVTTGGVTDSDAYNKFIERLAALNEEAFRIPERLRLPAKGGGLMRTNFAMGSRDDDPKPLPEDPTKPVNPFGPKPIKPLGDMKMAGSDRYQRILEEIINEMEDALGRELTNEEYDLAGQLAYDKLNSPPGSIDYAKGGRVGLSDGSYNPGARYQFLIDKFNSGEKLTDDEVRELEALEMSYADESKEMADGGRVNYALGTRPTAQESGLGGLPIEADMRYNGGFMPYGAKEKADDVPARLSKNEFVFTADAVRAAGGGSVQKGAQKMYNTMKQLEAKPEAKGMMA